MGKGTEENPFENVNVAFEHIKGLEQIALKGENSHHRKEKMCILDFATKKLVPSWLDPDTAFLAKEAPQDSFIVTKQQSGMFSFKPNLVGRKYLFRGQIKDFRNKRGDITCVPNLFRDEAQDYFLKEMILSQEMYALIDSHPMVQLLGKQGVDLCGYHFQMFTNYGGISQHYFNKTRFLDLTSDEDAAKFFSCCDYHWLTDSYTPHVREGIGVIYYYEIVMPFAFQVLPAKLPESTFQLSTIGKQIFPRSGAQHGYLMDLSKGLDFNSLPFTNKVYFRHVPEIAAQIYERAQGGMKYMPQSILDQYWREKMSSSQTDRRISETALQLNLGINKKENKSFLYRKLKERGFTIYKGSPSFTPDQLRSFYDDIKNGWWEDFCANIYFHGEDGKQY